MATKGNTLIGRFLLTLIALLVAGCASSSIVVGTKRPAIQPSQVKIYLHPPKKYEEIALVEASSKSSYSITDQGKMEVVIERMKEEAAKIGANGLLLESTGNMSTGAINTGTAYSANGTTTYGTGYSASVMHKTGNGLAIYVEEE